MSNTHPYIIETQLRLIRAFQKGYIEALEAGDWQTADYRCSHLNRLCEGLYYLSQSLELAPKTPAHVSQRSPNGWINSIRPYDSPQAAGHPLSAADKSKPPSSLPEAKRSEWSGNFQGLQPPPIDEVWDQ